MSKNARKTKRLAAPAISAILALCLVALFPTSALAETSAELQSKKAQTSEELAKAQNELDEASDRYNSVLSQQKAAEKLAEEAQAEADGYAKQMEDIQSKLNVRVVEMYKNDEKDIFLNMILGASSLQEMIASFNMMASVNNSDANTVRRAKDIRSELAAKQIEAENAELEARTRAEEAQMIKENAQAKADDLRKRIDSLDASIRAKTLEEAAVAAAKASPSSSAKYTANTSIPPNGSVVDYAYSRIGCPYRWAGSGPGSFDCSGLVMWCYEQAGVSLPHGSGSLYSIAKARIPVSEAQPGDVLYRSGHVGICIESGGGRYIHAPFTGDVVKIATGGRWSCALRF